MTNEKGKEPNLTNNAFTTDVGQIISRATWLALIRWRELAERWDAHT